MKEREKEKMERMDVGGKPKQKEKKRTNKG